MTRLRRWLLASALGLSLVATPAAAHADPISSAILTVIGITSATAGPAYAAILATTTFILNAAAAFTMSAVATALGRPKSVVQERQASITTLQIGEVPRELVIGRVCTAGSLVWAFNFGGQYGTDWECMVIALADHEIDAIEGYYVNDVYHPYTADGGQADFNNRLDLEFINGSLNPDEQPARFTSQTDWDNDGQLISVAHIWVAYQFSEETWPQGRPSFRWVLRGKRLYDPSKDSTVPGGSGPHRWDLPATWEWSRNAYLGRYNWARGIYAGDQVQQPGQLLIGRGLSELEAPPAAAIASIRLCDEDVPTKDGGTEKRYCADGVIRADETYQAVEEMFAAAMAGVVTQPDGGLDIEPGHAKAAVVEITDDDIVVGTTTTFSRFLALDDENRRNTVVPRYIEPDQLWQDHAAPVRRRLADIAADGAALEETLSLSLVTSGTQAQRCGETKRRLNRLERRAALTLGPRFSRLEDGDWIGWTSKRYHGGARVVYRVDGWSQGPDWRMALNLREIASSAYSWDPNADEITPGVAPPPDPIDLEALSLSGVTLMAIAIHGDDGALTPAVRATWNTPVDAAVQGIRLELRRPGQVEVSPTTTTSSEGIASGQMLATNGVGHDVTLEARLLPLTDSSRTIRATPWTMVTMGALIASNVVRVLDVSASALLAEMRAATQDVRALQRTSEVLRQQNDDLARAALISSEAAFRDGQTRDAAMWESGSDVSIKWAFRQAINVLDDGVATTLRRLSILGAESADGLAYVLDLDTVKLSPTESFAQRLGSITSQFAGASAAITTLATATADATHALSERIDSVTATVGDASAGLVSQVRVLASDQATQALTLSGLSTTVGSHTATLTTYGSSINGLNLKYGVVVDVGSDGKRRVGGFAVNGTVERVEFAILADTFSISAADGSGRVSFGVIDGLTYATNLVAQTVFAGSITADKIRGGAVTDTTAWSSGSTVSLAVGSETTIGSGFYYGSEGGVHDIRVSVELATPTATPAGAIFRLRRDGVEVDRGNIFVGGSWGGSPCPFFVFDHPGPGYFHYDITGELTPGSGAGRAQRARVMLVELKR